MADDHQQDCDLAVYSDARDVLCTCNLPMSDSSSHPLARRGLWHRRILERHVREGRQTAAEDERVRRQDLAEKHFAPTMWARWKARFRLALARWKLSRQRRRLGRG